MKTNKVLLSIGFGLTILLYATAAVAQTGPTAWVGNMKDDTLSIVKLSDDTVEFAVGAGCENCALPEICPFPPPPPCINGPHDMAVSPDGTRAYVTSFDDGRINVVDATPLLSGQAPVVIGSGSDMHRPQGIVVNAGGTRVYATSSDDDAVVVYDVIGNNLGWAAFITVGNDPNGVALTPDGSKLYVTNNEGNTVSVINTSNNTVTETITVGRNPRRILIGDPPAPGVGLRVYVANVDAANNVAGTVSVIDVDTDTVVATVTLQSGQTSGIHPRGMALSPDKTVLYVTNYDSFNLFKINTADNTVAGVVGLTSGVNPYRIVVSLDGQMGYVTNPNNKRVSVHRLLDGALMKTIAVGRGPSDIDILP